MNRLITIDQVELTHQQERDWDATRTLLLVATPHFGHVLYELLSPTDHHAVFTERIPVAATDGVCMLINPNTFFTYDPGERLFIACHEILHTIFGHPELFYLLGQQGFILFEDGTRLPFVKQIADWAADYVINAILAEAKIGKTPEGCLLDRAIATSEDTFFTAYRKLVKHLPPLVWRIFVPGPSKPGQQGQGAPAGSRAPGTQDPQGQIDAMNAKQFDLILDPGTSSGTDPAQATAERNDTTWRITVDHAMDMARLQGRLPANLERVFAGVLEPKVDWTDKLQSTLIRTFTGDRWAYDNPNQEWLARDIYVPGRTGYGAADVVVGGDVSGSITDIELSMIKAEITGILHQIKPRRLVLIWCDAKVQSTHILSDVADLEALPPPKGGGGTSFIPVFEWVEENREELDLQIDGFVYITDLFGTFPSSPPDYPVVWCSVSPPHVLAPFGEVVHVPRQAKG